MAIVVITAKGNGQEWQKWLTRLNKNLDIRIYPNDTKREEVEFALAWNPPLGVFKKYPNLQCVASTGAGVDHILKDPDLPEQVRVTRVVDQQLTSDMTAYLVTYVMAHIRRTKTYRFQKDNKHWQQHSYEKPKNTRIGVLGMGELGRHAARAFNALGFVVSGWSKSGRTEPDVKMYAGPKQFRDFLSEVDILICLLPLTKETRNILNLDTFNLLPRGAYVINVARGQHLVDEDLITALDQGQLSGACLDVFRKEPLPPEHPFWQHDKITITPHIASITDIASVAPQIVENYERLLHGQPLFNEVLRNRGY